MEDGSEENSIDRGLQIIIDTENLEGPALQVALKMIAHELLRMRAKERFNEPAMRGAWMHLPIG